MEVLWNKQIIKSNDSSVRVETVLFKKLHSWSTQPNIRDLLDGASIFANRIVINGAGWEVSVSKFETMHFLQTNKKHSNFDLSVTHKIQNPDNTKQIMSYECYFWP